MTNEFQSYKRVPLFRKSRKLSNNATNKEFSVTRSRDRARDEVLIVTKVSYMDFRTSIKHGVMALCSLWHSTLLLV